jgi:hypothetical protein
MPDWSKRLSRRISNRWSKFRESMKSTGSKKSATTLVNNPFYPRNTPQQNATNAAKLAKQWAAEFGRRRSHKRSRRHNKSHKRHNKSHKRHKRSKSRKLKIN